MYRNENPGVFRHRHPSRFERPPNFMPSYPSPLCLRRSSRFPRRRILANIFPNLGLRPFVRQTTAVLDYRPQRPLINANLFNQQSCSKFASTTLDQTEKALVPLINSEKSNDNSLSHSSATCKGNMDKEEFKCLNFEFSHPFGKHFRNINDLWIETVAPNGRTYYYHAITRFTSWDRPENVQIFTLDCIRALAQNNHNFIPTPEIRINDMEIISTPLNQQAYTSVRPFTPVSTAVGIPPGQFMLPPPNLCNPPPFQAIPPAFNAQIVPRFPTYDYNVDTGASANKMLNSSVNTPAPLNINKTSLSVQADHGNAVPESHMSVVSNDIQMQESLLCLGTQKSSADNIKEFSRIEETQASPNVGEETSISEKEDKVNDDTKLDNDALRTDDSTNDSKEKVDNTLSCECDNQISPVEICTETVFDKKPIDKSRPVSRTIIPGSKWSVVWTGEGKVFFYNAVLRSSVWEMPVELKNRRDVLDLIESQPVITEVKQSETVSVSETKKIKIDVEPNHHKNYANEAANEESTEGPILEIGKEKEDIPHENRVQMFLQMLSEKQVSVFSTLEKELHKIVFDPRYLLLAPKERKQKFEWYVREKLEEEKNNRRKEVQKIKERFRDLLQEANVTSNTLFIDFTRRHFEDSRFKAVEKLKHRELLFNEFISELSRDSIYNISEKEKEAFLELLKERKNIHKNSKWSDVKKEIRDDNRFLDVTNDHIRKKLFENYIQKCLPCDISAGKEERINASIQNRKEEVQRDLLIHLKARSKERENHKHEATVSNFKALLMDLVRRPDITWHEARKMMKHDHRWSDIYDLPREERMQYFDKHIEHLIQKKREQFRQILKEIPGITLVSAWKDVKKRVLSDSRCKQFSSDERKCEKEFREYMKDKLKEAKADYNELLKETKIITHASKDHIKSSNHLENIINALEHDKRYLVLKCIEKERKEMLLSYIDKLYSRGPPPPPTAPDPERR